MSQIIVKGPGKFDLMVALFDNTFSSPRLVTFTVDSAGREVELEIVVNSVEREDGSGESWNFRGYLQTKQGDVAVQGYYSTKKRTGTMSRK